MRGSDSERMMAEIEAFLRTGEAPPPAPEPHPVSSPPVVPDFPVSDRAPDAGGRIADPGRRRFLARVLRPLRRGPAHPAGSGGHGGGFVDRPVRPGRPVRLGGPGGAGRVAPPGGWRSRPPSRGLPPEPPKWTPLRAVIVCAVLLALLVLPALYSRHSNANSGSGDHASAAPAGPGYSFLRVNRSGTPVRWNPCSPVYYETDLGSAPAYAGADLQAAVSDISRVTGILFVNSGSTAAFPTTGPVLTPGGQVGPVVIAWANPAQTSQVGIPAGATGADALARTIPVAAVDENTGHGVYVTGTMTIAADAKKLPEGFGPGGLGVLFLHQLGHLVGLSTVTSPGQIMSADVLSAGTGSFGAGDLAGLKRLGTGSGCLQAPSRATFQPSL